MLSDIASQKKYRNGRKLTPNQWKMAFLDALGRKAEFIPSLDGEDIIPLGQSSSDLTKNEMTDMIELMFQWGAENNVTFHEPEIVRAA